MFGMNDFTPVLVVLSHQCPRMSFDGMGIPDSRSDGDFPSGRRRSPAASLMPKSSQTKLARLDSPRESRGMLKAISDCLLALIVHSMLPRATAGR